MSLRMPIFYEETWVTSNSFECWKMTRINPVGYEEALLRTSGIGKKHASIIKRRRIGIEKSEEHRVERINRKHRLRHTHRQLIQINSPSRNGILTETP